MKNFLESLKDFLYDFMDYIMMFLIVVAVVGIIGWRLDILFAKDDPNFQTKDLAKESVTTEENVDENEKDKSDNKKGKKEEDKSDKGKSEDKDDDSQDKNSKDKDSKDKDQESEDKESKKEIVKISIPAGSPSQKIGEILEEKGLIKSSNEFYQKATSMDLEKHLRAGDYEIEADSSLEEIIKIIANQE